MKAWVFCITEEDIDEVVVGLQARHGDEAHEEALRLADVGRRIGSRRNSSLFRQAAQRLADDRPPARTHRVWLARLKQVITEFAAPRAATPTKPPF